MWRSLDEVHEIHEAARAVCGRCFVAIEVLCFCFLVAKSSSDVVRFAEVILHTLHPLFNLGGAPREGSVRGASWRPCRADATVADSHLADLTHADPINAVGPLADEALAEVWNCRA